MFSSLASATVQCYEYQVLECYWSAGFSRRRIGAWGHAHAGYSPECSAVLHWSAGFSNQSQEERRSVTQSVFTLLTCTVVTHSNSYSLSTRKSKSIDVVQMVPTRAPSNTHRIDVRSTFDVRCSTVSTIVLKQVAHYHCTRVRVRRMYVSCMCVHESYLPVQVLVPGCEGGRLMHALGTYS